MLATMIDSYLVTLAFTGSDESDPDGCGGEPIFDGLGGCNFSDYVSADDVRELLSPEQLKSVVDDCTDFYNACVEKYGDDCIDWPWDRIGGDFHFTRNGHGVGFWEHDYLEGEISDFLDKLARPYGTCELCRYADEDGATDYDDEPVYHYDLHN
jgi:hypothetical protein